MNSTEVRTLSAGHRQDEYSPFHPPAYRIEPGERVRVETVCVSGGAVRHSATAATNADLMATLGWVPTFPVTGPIFVEGAAPGDVLAVHIEQIEVADVGWVASLIGRGPAGDLLEQAEVRTFAVRDGVVEFGHGLSIPLAPMIGSIGVAPQDGPLRANTPGLHGGNLDCTLIGPGATLYLPVNVAGALLALGDLHAAMADGEASCTGVEIAGAVTLRVEIVKHAEFPLPLVVAGESVALMASAPTLDEAARQVVQLGVRWLAGGSRLTVNEATMLVSLVGQVRICQVVNPLMTCRLELPRNVLTRIGIVAP
jgi:amidase